MESESLPLFLGSVPGGVVISPGGELIYPLGTSLVFKHYKTGKQRFIPQHRNNICCVALSHDGAYVATGQCNDIGCKVRSTQSFPMTREAKESFDLGNYHI